MGHLAGKDVYRKLGRKIDGLPSRAPWNATLRAILENLYTAEEADLVVRMPYGPSTLDRVARLTGYEESRLRTLLDGLCDKGLVMDVHVGGEYRYNVSPVVIGIFEFTMMRTDGKVDHAELAGLFHEYLSASGALFRGNYGHGEQIGIMRALPHDGTLRNDSYVEVLDYEKAAAIVEGADRLCVGICSCRHEKQHRGAKQCDVPLDKCSSFDAAADFLVRHDLGREVSKAEMLENLAESRELGLVLNADNVQKNITFICHCCGCCCNALAGLTRFGLANVVMTSGFIAVSDDTLCKGCNFCEQACPIDAIAMVPDDNPATKKKHKPRIEETFCLGCGVCATKCKTGAMRLERREQRIIPPETTFHRVILTALERGTLQNQLFDNPQSQTHAFMRALVGGFLKLPPVKKHKPRVDETFCLGCGVCATKCKTGAMRLERREQRIIPPETTFHRVILTALERGTLQNQLFDNPQSQTHAFMRALVGGFLKLPPVKKALMSDLLRSRFLAGMEAGVSRKGGESLTRM